MPYGQESRTLHPFRTSSVVDGAKEHEHHDPRGCDADAYDLQLYEDVKKRHDAECSDGRLVQIKATMKKKLTFSADHVPNYYLGVQVGTDGALIEVFNGPGAIA